MRWVGLLLVAALSVTLTVRGPAFLDATGLTPIWLLLPVLLFSMHATPGRAAFCGWGLGLTYDLLSLEPLGWHAFLFAAAALLLARTRRQIFLEHPMTQAIAAFLLSFAVSLLALIRIDVAAPVFRLGAKLPLAFGASVATAAVFPLLCLFEKRAGVFRGFRESGRYGRR